MKIAGIIQAALLLLLLAFAASCAVSKEYANRVFKPQEPLKTNGSRLAIKFMKFDSGSASDSIELAKVFGKVDFDSTMVGDDSLKTNLANRNKLPVQSREVLESKQNVAAEAKTMPKNVSSGTIRSKRVRQ